MTVIPALMYALSGYMASTTEETFKPLQFFKTLLIGSIVGVIEFEMGVTYDQATLMLSANFGAMYLIDKFVNAVGKFGAKLQSMVGSLTPAQQRAIQQAVQIAFNTMFPLGASTVPTPQPLPATTTAPAKT